MKLLFLLASLAFGQSTSFGDFSGGLNTSVNGLLIQENESPSLQNVVLDQTGGITRREGYIKRNASSAIGGGSQDVNAVYQLEQSDGDRYCVAFSSTTGYSSTDACQTFSAFVSSLTLNNDVNCDSAEDALFCVNGQYNMKFDGSNDTSFTSNPSSLKYIRVHRNYCFASGNSTNPSRLYWSNLGDCDTWAATTDFVDVAPNDGDVVVGIGEPIFDMLPIYKKFSTWVLKGNSSLNFELVNVNKAIGAVNHRAIRNFNNVQLFDSVGANGGQPGIYGFNGIVVKNYSDKLRNDIDQLDSFKANEGTKVVDGKPDWDLGTFDSYAMSSQRNQGFMQSSYTAVSDDSTDEFSEGTLVQLSTRVISGKLTLDYATDFSTFSALDVSTPTVATTIAGCPSVQSGFWNGLTWGRLATSYCAQKSYSNSLSTGSWRVGIDLSATTSNIAEAGFKFMSVGTGYLYGRGYSVSVYKTGASNTSFRIYKHGPTGRSILCSASVSAAPGVRFLRVSRTKDGLLTLERSTTEGGTYTTVCSTTNTENYGTSNAIFFLSFEDSDIGIGSATFNSPFEPAHYSTGTIVSRAFDTYISTPTWGLFEAVLSSNSPSSIDFETQVATSSSGAWDSLVAGTLDAEIASAQKRYLRYKASFETAVPSDTARLDSVDMAAASTGTWTSGELYLSVNMSATWGLFVCNQTTSGEEASISYEIRTSTYVGGTAYADYVSQSCNAAITVSTGAYAQVRITTAIGVATETARVDAFAINWKEGSQARSASAAVFGTRYHYGGQSKDGTHNDVMYVLDQKGAWVKWIGVRPRFLNVVNKNFIMADSTRTTGGYIHHLYQSDSDDGTTISAFWESKDLALGNLADLKSIERVYAVYSSSDTDLTVTVKADGGLTSSSYDIDLSTAGAFGINSRSIEPPINGSSFRLRFSNDAASAPWEILGFGLRFRNIGMREP